MKAKKLLALVLTLCMVVSLLPAVYAAPADALSFADAAATELTPKLDGQDIKVTMYEDLYLGNTTHADQKVAVYVPENATASSPIILYVNNSGWQSNSYSGRKGVDNYGWVEETKRGETKLVLKGDYSSEGNDEIGKMLSEGYVIVSYGCRSRNNGASEDGNYYGHSPATMSDTKAVVRYLRYNADLLPAGDPEKIVVTGTSGGGALSVIIAGTGDSADYFPALYESGAAGIDYVDGKYVNTISDSVWATIAYCPITDLGNACAAYEWTWGETRFAQIEAGEISYNVDTETQKAAYDILKPAFEEYIDSLGIGVTAETMEAEIIALMTAEIEETIEELGIVQMKADLGDYTWLTFNEDGSYTYDYEAHKYAVGLESTFKAASAFSNYGMTAYAKERNEDNLFGSVTDEYSPYNEFAWDNDDKANAVGKDDTGLAWDEFLATEDGARLQKQMKMVSPFQYLLDAEGESTSAPNWYVRYGMYDRDSSWAIEVALLECMKADKSIENINFEFAWLKGHSGNYDVQEAYAWLAERLAAEKANTDIADAAVTELTPTVDGEPVKVKLYVDNYSASPVNESNELINIYVPENASAASPIILNVNNSGWQSNSYPDPAGSKATVVDGQDYDGANDKTGVALKEGYVIVSYGCRGRSDKAIDGVYYGHSPATMTDTKAVVRYLRANDAAIPGDAEKIVVTGTSGGGALSVVIAGSGNSADYYPSLYEIGAAGIDYVDGKYVSTIGDDVWATIAYCPITDLGNACAAYEWTWAEARSQLIADGVEVAGRKGTDKYTEVYKMGAENMAAATEVLTANYIEYIDSLGLESVNSANLEATIIELMEKEIAETIKEIGIEQMKADLAGADWLTFNDDGSFVYDYDKHVYWVGTQSVFKAPSAFSNTGMSAWAGERNEDNLFGAATDAYSPFNEYSWNNDDTANAVGKDDTGLAWDEFLATEDGARLALQMKMTSPIEYLLDAEDGDSAPYWYVRYGMADRDSSFAVEAVLNAAMEADKSIEDVNFEYAWLKGHSGNYDVAEAYAWLKETLYKDYLVKVEAGDEEAKYIWNYVESEKFGNYYELTNVVYVGAPVAEDYQSLHVYVPADLYEGKTVNGYTAETAPVIMANSASGWAGKTPSTIDGFGKSLEMDWAGILEHGYVLVSIGTRGPATQNDDGTYNGKAPENVADAKAAVRFLKANADVIPGDMDKIISAGTSGGGGMSTIIGASGNADEYLPYLYAMNACGVEKQGDEYVNTGDDSVFGMLAYAPITDLDNADLGYNWFYGAAEDYTDFEKAVAEDMAAAFEDYILGLGAWETMDEFEEGFVAMFEESLNANGGEEGEWIVKNEDGTYSIAGGTAEEQIANIVANHNSRGKAVLGFDNLTPGTDSRAENQLFGLTGTTTNRMHYSEAVANIMLANKAEYEKLTEGEARWSVGFKGAKSFAGGGYTAFQQVYSENEGIPGYTDMIDAYETALTDEMKARVYMMNPINYIIEYMNGGNVQPAEHFRGVYGSDDSNTSPTVIYTVKEMLEKAGIDADYSMFWNGGHGKFTKEKAETEAFFAWVEDICEEPVIPAIPSTPDKEEEEKPEADFIDVAEGKWFYADVKYAAENGLMNGVGDGKFDPYGTASRAMVVTVLYRIAGEPAVTGTNSFADLTADWYKSAVQWAVENGITKGVSDTQFNPNAPVSRQEIAVFLYRFAKAEAGKADLSEFKDADEVAAWAADAMAWAVAEGLINGVDDDTLAPKADSNRAQLATILARFDRK